jgi:tagatose 1,6-diphosphate aldolase
MDQGRMTRRTLTVGKYRALQRASTPDGTFNILALDHLDSLRRVMNPTAPMNVTLNDLAAFKAEVMRCLAGETSGVLLDPVLGAAQAIQGSYLGSAGLLVELEKADYQLEPMPQHVEILADWGVEKIKRMGADGVKLFFYYNPDAETLVAAQEALIERVALECDRSDIPLYAEPILLSGDDDAKSFTRRLIDTAQRVAKLGVDVLKLEFPASMQLKPDESAQREACDAITKAIHIPWVLLSAGVDFDTYCRQVNIACESGASGFIAGRAVWGEAATITDTLQRARWLEETGRQRLKTLCEAAHCGKRWTDKLECQPVGVEWYATY